jgi:uncharacterized protein (TIGR03083 family)
VEVAVPAPALPRADAEAAVAAERRHLAAFVADLTDAEWDTPSLCSAWTVRHVVAHLTTTTRLGILQLIPAALRARGSFDRMEMNLAADLVARHSPSELVALLRGSADSTRRTPGSSPMDPLMDIVIHAQDIARPLGRPYTSPPSVVAACLAYVAPNRFLGAPRRIAGVQLVSSDTGWTFGSGPSVHGADIDLLLLASGRRAAALSGSGVPVVAGRL